MPNNQQIDCNKESKGWFVYMVRCRDNSYYTGITTDLNRRVSEHNSKKKGARYTRSRQPVTLVYSEEAASRSIAAKREYRVRRLSVSAKNQLISGCKTVGKSKATHENKKNDKI